jgi:hypothetical protein
MIPQSPMIAVLVLRVLQRRLFGGYAPALSDAFFISLKPALFSPIKAYDLTHVCL